MTAARTPPAAGHRITGFAWPETTPFLPPAGHRIYARKPRKGRLQVTTVHNTPASAAHQVRTMRACGYQTPPAFERTVKAGGVEALVWVVVARLKVTP